MQYTKVPLTFNKQADLLISRGLQADRNALVQTLENVNYYRLSGYLYPYRQRDDTFKNGTTFEEIWRHYTFDRRLRLMVMDVIERVEISIRTQLIYKLAHKTGSFGYTKLNTYPQLDPKETKKLLNSILTEAKRSKEVFVQHFKTKYGDKHKSLPLWMAGEIISFGCTLTMYNGVTETIKRDVATYYGIPSKVLTSWLKTINVIRNICAHHSRLWNRVLGVKPLIPRKNKYPDWHEPVHIEQDRIFGVLTIFCYLLNIIAPQSKWCIRFVELLDDYSDISRRSMGFPENWTESIFWSDMTNRVSSSPKK